MPTHTVEQGDHMSGIAEKYGFQSIDLIWNHANNAELKKLRKDPHILFPGDQVFIPDKTQKSDSAPTTKLSTFTINISLLRLNLKLRDLNGDPVASKPVTILVEGATVPPPTTDGDGKTSSVILKSAKNATLQLGELQFPMKIGHLDPIDKQSGQIARLNNLGYEAGDTGTVDADAFQSAVEEFQCDNSLPVNGNCDATTQAKLKDVHGC
jgi:N-acetylmuramoyl-L-alanine amidase